MPKSSWPFPPPVESTEFSEWVREIHHHVYGIGDDDAKGQLDTDNEPTAHAQGTAQALDTGGPNEVTAVNAKDAVDKKHDPGSGHSVIIKAADPGDGSTTVSGTADGTYDAVEQGMLNALATDVAAINSKLNALMAAQRTANQLG